MVTMMSESVHLSVDLKCIDVLRERFLGRGRPAVAARAGPLVLAVDW